MDVSALPPAVSRPTAEAPQSPAAQVAPGATQTRPETARPVEAVDRPPKPATIPGLGIPPLDTFEVGDNDDVPPPPAPPPERAVLADPVSSAPKKDGGENADTARNAAGPVDQGEAEFRPKDRPGQMTLPGLLSDLEDGPPNPTVDLLR